MGTQLHRTAAAASSHGEDRFVTFDCFDTLITRAVGCPETVSYLTGMRLRNQGVVDADPEVFAGARAEGQARAFRRYGDAHTLADIAVQQADILGVPGELASVLEREELATERAVTRGVPAVAERLARERAAGTRIAFLSDTPLPHGFIRELLDVHGLPRDGEPLWVSNELGAGKGRGTAFFAVADRLGGAPRDWWHVGDDARGDVRFARLSGVRPVLVTSAVANRYERLLESHRSATGGLASLLAGASRRTRLRLEVERPAMPAARVAVVAGVMAPLLAGYALWSLRQAGRARCKRVYVAASEGDAVLGAARRLAADLGADLELRGLPFEGLGGFPDVAGEPQEALRGLLDGEPFVVVHPGRPAAAPDGVATLLSRLGAGAATLECCLALDAAEATATRSLRGYLYDDVRGTGLADGRAEDLDHALDLAVTATCGPAGHRPDGDSATGDVADLRYAVDVLCDELGPMLSWVDPYADVRRATWEALRTFWLTPTPAEVAAWRGFCGPRGAAWPAGAHVGAPAPLRAVDRARRVGARLYRKAERYRSFAHGRRAHRRR